MIYSNATPFLFSFLNTKRLFGTTQNFIPIFHSSHHPPETQQSKAKIQIQQQKQGK